MIDIKKCKPCAICSIPHKDWAKYQYDIRRGIYVKFKVGAKIVVKDVHSGGNFENGDIVTVVKIGSEDDPNCYGAISPYDGLMWYLYDDEVSSATNADYIRSMSNEELAIYLSENSWGRNECKSGQENMDNPFATRCDEKCAEHCLEWLQKPYKGE